MIAAARAWLAMLGLALGAAAQDGAPPAALPPVPPTQFGLQVLVNSPVVVVARTVEVRGVGPATELLKVRVLERMRGLSIERDAELPVLAPRGLLRFGEENLLCLRPWRGGERYEIVQRVGADEAHYDERLSVVRRSIWLLEERDPMRRTDATLDFLLELLGTDKDWSRGYGLAELRWMAREQRWVFTAERTARLRAAGRASPRDDVRSGVDSVAALLRSPVPSGPQAAATEQSRP
ncbi:MAG TPA: hypothetical protein VFY71_01400 [Planctomycetota bacterium]|nr:hypothetical protein [Planctomycetota bacterium]